VTRTLCDHFYYHRSCCSCWAPRLGRSGAIGRRWFGMKLFTTRPLGRCQWSRRIWASLPALDADRAYAVHSDGEFLSGTRLSRIMFKGLRRGWQNWGRAVVHYQYRRLHRVFAPYRGPLPHAVDRGQDVDPRTARAATILKRWIIGTLGCRDLGLMTRRRWRIVYGRDW